MFRVSHIRSILYHKNFLVRFKIIENNYYKQLTKV